MAQPFPGFGPDGTLVLPLPRAVWRPPAAAVILDGCAFEPKRELHVTLVGTALGARLAAAFADGVLAIADVARDFDALDWGFARSGAYRLLAKDKRRGPGAPRHARSIVELVRLPAMTRFHRRLAARLGVATVVPPPHVTLWVHGDPAGIGVPSEAELERLTVRTVDRAELPEG
jgi:hypothetical protein